MNLKTKNHSVLYWRFIFSRKLNQGITLIELLVVILFVGILGALALPNLIKQTGKAKEVEYRNVIATFNRSQQAFHFEKGRFAYVANNANATFDDLGISFDEKNIDGYTLTLNPNSTTIQIINNSALSENTRGYSGGVFVIPTPTILTIQPVICFSELPAVSIVPPISPIDCAPNNILK